MSDLVKPVDSLNMDHLGKKKKSKGETDMQINNVSNRRYPLFLMWITSIDDILAGMS